MFIIIILAIVAILLVLAIFKDSIKTNNKTKETPDKEKLENTVVVIVDTISNPIAKYKETKTYRTQKKLIEATKIAFNLSLGLMIVFCSTYICKYLISSLQTDNPLNYTSDIYNIIPNIITISSNVFLFLFVFALSAFLCLLIYDFTMGIRFRVSKKYKEIFEAISTVSTASIWSCIFLHSLLNIIDNK